MLAASNKLDLVILVHGGDTDNGVVLAGGCGGLSTGCLGQVFITKFVRLDFVLS